MNLLPKSHEEFSQTEYWNKFFKKLGNKSFEWYGEYPELCGQLHKYIKSKDNILVVGCGNSKLSADLYDVGYRSISNIDISPVVVKTMSEANSTQRPLMNFLQMDATEMSFDNDQFTTVLDKGTLDALMTDNSDLTRNNVLKYFTEVDRVSRLMGRYVCISLLQEHVLNILLEYFTNHNWMFRVVRCFEVENKSLEENQDLMPVFMIIATKMRQLPNKIFELSLGGEKIERVETVDAIKNSVVQAQKAAMICNGLKKSSIAEYSEVSIDLHRPGDTSPRFTIIVVDQKAIRTNGKFAAFIVPQGRETDWLFSTKEGRNKLLKSVNFERVAIVSMHREQTYTSWDSVKEELGESIKGLAPHGLKTQIPYLSLGTDVGKRDIIFEGLSEISGGFIIEDVEGDNKQIFRRLVFLKNQFVIQSEARIKTVGQQKKIDLGYLACQHHLFMTIGVQSASVHRQQNASCNTLVIGLGGGGLCSFMTKCLPNINVTAIELDPSMVEIAKNYFGLTINQNLTVVIEDGLKYIKTAANNPKKFNAVIFDVDNKESSLGISCPPISFLEENVLQWTRQCLTDSGIFILNLVARDETLKANLMLKLRQIFPSVCIYKIDEELNEVVYCRFTENITLEQWKEDLQLAANDVNRLAKKKKLSKEELITVEEYLEELKI